jgi:hypothetical protein
MLKHWHIEAIGGHCHGVTTSGGGLSPFQTDVGLPRMVTLPKA